MKQRTKHLILIIALLLTAALLAAGFALYTSSFNTPNPPPLSSNEELSLYNSIEKAHPASILQNLPYPVIPAELPVQAHSAIVIDASNGCVLYEKNADALIPPASMTKLVVMYVVFEELQSGRISLDDIVPLQKEAWAINAPPNSSLMFLGEGQKVSLDELLTGLAVVSGNDAAVAAAQYISGSMEKFIERMNLCVRSLGLRQTRFVESSGYSELNMTTPREFASFCKIYLEKFPESLEKYHSVESFTYPKAHNLKDGLSYTLALESGNALEGTLPITQYATNKTLGEIDGADGIKTGFIYESGYNLALTVNRDGTRFISVTMGGPGRGSVQGNEIRLNDAKIIMDWAFSTFKTLSVQDTLVYHLPVFYGKENALSIVESPYFSRTHTITIPLIAGFKDGFAKLEREIELPDYIKAPIHAGETVGYCRYMIGDICIETTELISSRSIEKAALLKTALDSAAEFFHKKNTNSINLLQEQYRSPLIK